MKIEQVVQRISRLLEVEIKTFPAGALRDCISRSLLSGGKRIRPAVCFGAAEALLLPIERVDSFALALELIHTASLIHDDLPALDNAEKRRGIPAAHREFGEGIALIAGDFLIARAPEILARDRGLGGATKVSLMNLVAQATASLCEGQILDLKQPSESELCPITLEQQIIACAEKKTGALFEAAAAAPAIVSWGGQGGEEELALRQFGRAIGLVFQLTDDLMDATNLDERRWPNAVAFLGFERTIALITQGVQAARSALKPFNQRAEFLEQLVKEVSTRAASKAPSDWVLQRDSWGSPLREWGRGGG